jgi:hypothetical protein
MLSLVGARRRRAAALLIIAVVGSAVTVSVRHAPCSAPLPVPARAVRQQASPPRPAAAITALVQTGVTGRVLLLEAAVTAADQDVVAYCQNRATALAHQAQVLRGVAASLGTLTPPPSVRG